MWKWVRVRKRSARRQSSRKHYREHKEAARVLVHARLSVLNEHYQFSYNRVAIKDQKSRWGSCSKKGNLNFNYRLLFLPPHLADYVIVHELCHLAEFNHGASFWNRVAEVAPEYRSHRNELRAIRIR
jgi:predicted metal-dependent hydrolase